MQTIVEPKQHIDKLWGKQQVQEDQTYRLMRYVLRVDYEGKVLLHNVVTGQLVVLKQDEVDALDNLPMVYRPVMERLVCQHYLVPEDYDEHHQVMSLRTVLRKLSDAQKHDGLITHYTILPTTGCNARCYYCFEYGTVTRTMSEQAASEVVAFISEHCGEKKKVSILWFGGEPTLAANRITQICNGLRNNGITYYSEMISNGYLLDERMIDQAKTLWNLRHIQITVDGVEEQYNRIKSFVNPISNPYQRVMHNIGSLIRQEIHVNLRMNIDISNHNDYERLVNESLHRFGRSKYLHVYAYPIIGEHRLPDGRIMHGSEEWFSRELVKLNDLSRNVGMAGASHKLPFLSFQGCGADNDQAITINPNGDLVRCPEQFDDDQIVGSARNGLANFERFQSWKEFADYNMCVSCCYYPKCIKLVNCKGKEECHFHDRNHQYIQEIKRRFDTWKSMKQ